MTEKKIRKTIAAVTAGLVVLLVTACGAEDSASNKLPMRAYEVSLPSGKTVTCVRNGAGGGVSCDWNNVR